MLTENRRKYLKERNSLGKGKAEYDYRVLKWLETMLDPGEEGGIGDINRVLDTLAKDSIRKHLKDVNVIDLLKLVEKLLAILDIAPVIESTNGHLTAVVNGNTWIDATPEQIEMHKGLVQFKEKLEEYIDPMKSPKTVPALKQVFKTHMDQGIIK